ncbi:MAG: hypothetical protein NVS1B10_01210 [Candidatus Saccharimonadales bacterium]
MNQLHTQGIILNRTDYSEADRILTILTPTAGKLRLMARGVRKPKSRLAGGIELFSTSEIAYIKGRGEIGTLVSTRLIQYYSNIVNQIDRVQLGYELIKILNRGTEDQPEASYYNLLEETFRALDDPAIDVELIRLWFNCQLLSFAGYTPNLLKDSDDKVLLADQKYIFDYDKVAFQIHENGDFTADNIKLLRLNFSGQPPKVINQVNGTAQLRPVCLSLIQTMMNTYIRL